MPNSLTIGFRLPPEKKGWWVGAVHAISSKKKEKDRKREKREKRKKT